MNFLVMLIILPVGFGAGWTRGISDAILLLVGCNTYPTGKLQRRHALAQIAALVFALLPFLFIIPMRNEFQHIDLFTWLKDNYLETFALLWWAMIFCGIATFVIGTIQAIDQIVAYKKKSSHKQYIISKYALQRINSQHQFKKIPNSLPTRDTEPEKKRGKL